MIASRILQFSIGLMLVAAAASSGSGAVEPPSRGTDWVDRMLASRGALISTSPMPEDAGKAAIRAWFSVKDDFPIEWDWTLQDGGSEFYRWFQSLESTSFEQPMIKKAIGEFGLNLKAEK